MTPEQVALVQQGFEKVPPVQEQFTAAFYQRLFELNPALRSLFKTDLREQGKKLAASLALVVRSLNAPEAIIPAVQAMGKRHVNYGVKAEDYATVGQALLDTLASQLKADFTPQAKEAWAAAYGVLATVMKEAAYGKAA